MSQATQPVIIIGMHRSGTTMLVKMLRDLGLFIGWNLDGNCEATFFLYRNITILNAYNGSWTNPTVIDNLLNHPAMRRKVIDNLYKDLKSYSVLSYLGPKHFLKYRSVFRLDSPWGWKDPRNTFLLPLWLEIFPDAKLIHIYRNGIDVAQSLLTRQVEWLTNASRRDDHGDGLIPRQKTDVEHRSYLKYILRKFQFDYRAMNPLEKYKRLGISPCISIEKGFELWCSYIERAFQNTAQIQNECLNICYEEFISRPEHFIGMVREFCCLPYDEDKIRLSVASIKSTRRYAFMENKARLNVYNILNEHLWMRRLGYSHDNYENNM